MFQVAAAFNISGDISNDPSLIEPTVPAEFNAFKAASPESPAPKVRIVSTPPNLAATAF